MSLYKNRNIEQPKKGQLCLCRCPNWCESGYQVATWDGKKFDYDDCPNDIFDSLVKSWIPLSEDGEPELQLEKIRVPKEIFMLVWFTNPDRTPNASDGNIETGISTQFFSNLQVAEKYANILYGNKIILRGYQNGEPESNIFWFAVKIYGNDFDISKLTISKLTIKK